MASSSTYTFFHCHYAFQKFPFFRVTLCVLHSLQNATESKWLEMRRKDREDIERNRIHIRTMANLLHSIMQVSKSSSSADPVTTSHTPPPPAAVDINDPFMTSKRPVRQAFPDIKDEEEVEEEECDDGGEERTYGD